MTTLSNGRAVPLAAVVAFSAVVAANGQFYTVGFAPGCVRSLIHGLSADGRVAAGWSEDTFSNYEPGFTWTADAGRTDFGTAAGLPAKSLAFAISGDGRTVAGATRLPVSGAPRPFVYRGPGSFQTLGTIGSFAVSQANGISGDGSVVVGNARTSDSVSSVAFRWTQAGGMQSLGYTRSGHNYSAADGISRDGRSIVGYSYGDSSGDAFVWTTAHGMTALHGLGGEAARAHAANIDGSIIVGESPFAAPGNISHAVMWRGGGILDLGVTSAMIRDRARATSDDGSVVVGDADMRNGDQAAFIWTVASGTTLLSDYLVSIGVGVPTGWRFLGATSISADGRTIAGNAVFGSGDVEGFVITIPAPSALLTFGSLGVFGVVRRRRA